MVKLEEAIDVLIEGAGVASRKRAVELVRQAMVSLERSGHVEERSESEDVMEFMLKFGHMFVDGHGTPLHQHPTLRRPRHLTLRKATHRHAQLQEEVDEFYKAMHADDLAEMADALIDLVYFAKGTANLMGLPWKELWDDVHGANMRKERGAKVRGEKSYAVECVKPEGWVGPRTLEVLGAAGYDVARDRGVAWDDPEHAPGGAQTSTEALDTTPRGA